MSTKDLRRLPKVRDALSYLYVEHARIDQHEKAIAIERRDEAGFAQIPVPVASLCLLMLGPGTTITHAAVRALADNNCLVLWCGEEGVRLYAHGIGGTRNAAALLRQATLATNPALRLQVVLNMYRKRLGDLGPGPLSLRQIRGKEGIRVREAYARASREFGVPWHGRAYNRRDWRASDPVNRALSAANSCLYGLCHAAILSAGYSPALGFIHTGKQLSFVYDIADLYKADVTIPAAFKTAAESREHIERRVRLHLRDYFRKARLLQRIIPDIEEVLDIEKAPPLQPDTDYDTDDDARPGPLWDPAGHVPGGVAYDLHQESNPEEPPSVQEQRSDGRDDS